MADASNEILTAVIGGLIPVSAWAIKWLLNKRKSESEIEKSEAESDYLGSTTIQNFVKALGDLQAMNHAQLLENAEAFKENIRMADELSRQAREMAKIKYQYEETIKRNQILLKKSELLSETIQNLEKIVVQEQVNKQRLRKIIKRLVGQLEESNIKPIINEEELQLL